jgi:RimJ/RimL family protein N-acetyltransferase
MFSYFTHIPSLTMRTNRAKILEKNEPSIRLFLKLGYQEVKRVPVFGEIHYELAAEEALERVPQGLGGQPPTYGEYRSG